MEFKIDTKASYTNVIPDTERLDAILTEAIRQKWNNIGQSGSLNLIVELQNIKDIDDNAFNALLDLQEDFRKNHQSIVFMGLEERSIKGFKIPEDEMVINIVPTIAEAIDMINMEILERDIFKDEE